MPISINPSIYNRRPLIYCFKEKVTDDVSHYTKNWFEKKKLSQNKKDPHWDFEGDHDKGSSDKQFKNLLPDEQSKDHQKQKQKEMRENLDCLSKARTRDFLRVQWEERLHASAFNSVKRFYLNKKNNLIKTDIQKNNRFYI